MLEWYFKNISQPWLKLSLPAIAFLECTTRNFLDLMQIHVDWTKGFLAQTVFILWIISNIWVALGFIVLIPLIFIKQADKKNKEALLYAGFLIWIITFFSLSPAAIEIY